MYTKKFEEFENKFNETKNEFRREIDLITSEFKKQTEEFVNTIKELREAKSRSFNFESDIMLGIRNSIKEATMKTLIDHYGPLSDLIKEEVLNYKDEFQDVFNNALNECFSNEEFKEDPVGNGSAILSCKYDFEEIGFDKLLKYGLLFKNDETLDRHLFKLEIETKLKNIAERLNAGKKIDWKNGKQYKFFIYYDNENEILRYHYNFRDKEQGKIYCLDQNFLEVAKQEIGEENLIKYFKE